MEGHYCQANVQVAQQIIILIIVRVAWLPVRGDQEPELAIRSESM